MPKYEYLVDHHLPNRYTEVWKLNAKKRGDALKEAKQTVGAEGRLVLDVTPPKPVQGDLPANYD